VRLEQRLGGGHDGGPSFVGRKRSSTGHERQSK
jgi:hypothetical protein